MTTNFNQYSAAPEQLVALGKTAATTAETSGLSLTDAVVRSIGMTKLNAQQVRRVVEAANHEAFHRKFASMESHMRVVELDGGPADPAAVMERLEVAALPMKTAARNSDYLTAPQYHPATAAYAEVFTKTAALQPVDELRAKLAATHDELTGSRAARQFEVESSVVKLAHAVRQALADGVFYEDLEAAWGAVNPKLATEMLGSLAPAHAPPGVKTASRRLVPTAEVVTAFQKFASAASQYEVVCEAIRGLEQELIRVEDFLRSAR